MGPPCSARRGRARHLPHCHPGWVTEGRPVLELSIYFLFLFFYIRLIADIELLLLTLYILRPC